MPIGTGLAIGLGVASAASSVAGGAIAAHGAGNQADAANRAADLQHQDQVDALNFQKQEYADQQRNFAPWLKTGQGAITTVGDLLNHGGFPDWTGKFAGPTNV